MRNWERGVTLLEALIVIGLIAIIIAVAIPLFVQLLQSYTVQTAASNLATNIRFARNAAVKQKVQYQIVVNDSGEGSPNTYKIQNKPSGSWVDYTKLDLDLPGGVEIIAGSVNTIAFDSRGVATLTPAGGTITLEAPNDDSYVLQISTTGAVTVIEQ